MYFEDLDLNDNVLDALYDMRFDKCTPVQEKCIPEILKGHDVLGVAQTGTGKTAAYLLPVLSKLADGGYPESAINCVIMSPTRELAQQIDQAMQGFAYYLNGVSCVAVYGGNDGNRYDQELKSLSLGADVVIATPGRFISHLSLGNVDLSKVSFFILDEADRMLDMGFIDDIRKIMQMLPKQRQTLLFSATFSPPIRKLAQDFMHTPEMVEVAAQNTTNANVEQHIIAVDALKKRNLLERLIVDLHMNQVIVFCKTKQSVDQVTRDLVRRNIAAQSIHGDKSQQSRLETLNAFKEGTLRVLVATDVAARGLDIAELPFVINYELPTQPEDYVHRIGRTGRAGADGVAISLMDKTEQKMFESIKELTGSDLNVERIEGFEPYWWGNDNQDEAEAQPVQHNDSRSRREDRNKRNEYANKSDKSSKKAEEKNDPGIVCGKIAGRTRRSCHERQPCALLQPGFGVK